MEIKRGQLWKNKKTGREARVRSVREHPVGHHALDYRYRTSNPNSRAWRMTRHRRMTVPISAKRFAELFDFVSDGST